MMPNQPAVSHQQKLEWFKKDFRPHFDEWVVEPVKRLIDSKEGMPSFIWLACAIDWVAGFWYGDSTKNKVSDAYTGYIRAFFPVGKYDADGLYNSLRNGLVHSYTIKGMKYALIHQHPEIHLKPNQQGYIVLNLEDFFQDWVSAKEAYFNAVELDSLLLDKAFDRYQREGFLGLVQVSFP